MSCQRFLVACLVVLVAHEAAAGLWKFGQDHPTLTTLTRVTGDIKPLQGTKNVQLNVPNCYRLTYVAVKVDSRAREDVKYYSPAQTVSIYIPKISLRGALYEIVGRGVPQFPCVAGSKNPVAVPYDY
ncbi:uncharacterized protein LOC142972140 [Anticarsia gemmatalis]|uniref:uncharacterized protein LOC142972140 n=1 Tax=Anticarsia gemmatalis TaxID=129554 RepID=UPI003F7708AC